MIYRIFNFLIDSQIELPELPRAEGQSPEFTVRLGRSDDLRPESWETRLVWRWRGGQVGGSVARQGDHIRYLFEGYCVFYLAPAGLIWCERHPDCPAYLLRHFLLNQVIPRAAAAKGRYILHASSVVLKGQDRAVAFVGPTGYGKSTLAMGLAEAGAKLLADDTIQLEVEPGGVCVAGSFPGVRLFPDALTALARRTGRETPAVSQPVAPYSDKRQLMWGVETNAAIRGNPLLEAIFVLNDPNRPVRDIKVSRLNGGLALLPIVRSAFSIDPGRADIEAGLFTATAKLLRQDVTVYSLDYPRDFKVISEIRNLVAERCALAA